MALKFGMWISKYVTSQTLFAFCRWETLSVICYHLLVKSVNCYFIVYLPFAPLHVRQKTIMNQCLWFLVSKACLVVTLQHRLHGECDKMIHFVYLHMRKRYRKRSTKINPRINLATLYIHSLNSHWLSRSTCASLCHSTALPTLPIIHTCHSAPQQSSPQPTPAVPDSLTHSLPHPSLLCKTVQYFPNPDWFSTVTNSACPGISSCFSEFSNHFYCQLSFLPGSPCWYLSYISNCIKSCSSADCFRTEPY